MARKDTLHSYTGFESWEDSSWQPVASDHHHPGENLDSTTRSFDPHSSHPGILPSFPSVGCSRTMGSQRREQLRYSAKSVEGQCADKQEDRAKKPFEELLQYQDCDSE